jgi:hypothetical protein
MWPMLLRTHTLVGGVLQRSKAGQYVVTQRGDDRDESRDQNRGHDRPFDRFHAAIVPTKPLYEAQALHCKLLSKAANS